MKSHSNIRSVRSAAYCENGKQRRVRNKAYAGACAKLAKECRRTSRLDMMYSYLRAENTFFLGGGKTTNANPVEEVGPPSKERKRSVLARLSNELLGLGKKRKRTNGKKSIVLFGIAR